MAILWRGALLLIGLAFLAVAGNDAYVIVTTGGPLAYSLGAIHGLVFFVLGATIAATSLFIQPSHAKPIVVDFLRDVFGRRNLLEFGCIIAAAVAVAFIWAKWHG